MREVRYNVLLFKKIIKHARMVLLFKLREITRSVLIILHLLVYSYLDTDVQTFVGHKQTRLFVM